MATRQLCRIEHAKPVTQGRSCWRDRHNIQAITLGYLFRARSHAGLVGLNRGGRDGYIRSFSVLGHRAAGLLCAGFAAELPARGWGSDSIYLHLRLMRELSAWMSAQGLGTGQLSPAEADRFVPVMRATRRRLVSVKGLAPVLGYLRDQGVLAEPDVVPASERDALLLAYQQYLRGERGLSDATCGPTPGSRRRSWTGQAIRCASAGGADRP